MTHSVHFLIVYNELCKTRCISSQQANSLIPYTSADTKIHPDRGPGDGGPCHGTIGTIVNQPWYHVCRPRPEAKYPSAEKWGLDIHIFSISHSLESGTRSCPWWSANPRISVIPTGSLSTFGFRSKASIQHRVKGRPGWMGSLTEWRLSAPLLNGSTLSDRNLMFPVSGHNGSMAFIRFGLRYTSFAFL